MIMASEPIAYSSLLQDFIEPMYTENETEASFFAKCWKEERKHTVQKLYMQNQYRLIS